MATVTYIVCVRCGTKRRVRASHVGVAKYCSIRCGRAQQLDDTAEARRPERRFFEKVKKTDSCWEWIGRRNRKGYGEFMADGRRQPGRHPVLAHRYSYELHVGPIPDGLALLHQCDNPACVRPEHLRPGTREENNREMKARDRVCFGSKRPNAKLTEENVKEMHALRATGLLQREIAAKFGVNASLVSEVLSGKKWARTKKGHL